MDKMFTQLANLQAQVTALNSTLATLAPALQGAITPLGAPIGTLVAVAPTIVARTSQITGQLLKIKTELQLMKN